MKIRPRVQCSHLLHDRLYETMLDLKLFCLDIAHFYPDTEVDYIIQ